MTDRAALDGIHAGTPPAIPVRHPLGLPAGSVRALLTLMVVGLFWLMLLLPEDADKPIHIPLYLYYLTFFVLGSYFAIRGHTSLPAGTHGGHPLHLPRGSIRFFVMAGFVAAFAWSFYRDPEIVRRLIPSERINADIKYQAYVPLVLLAAFFVGIIVHRLATLVLAREGRGLPAWYQDLLAWISLLAMLVLAAEIMIRLVIYPRAAPERQFDMPYWESFVGALVSFYFGARSSS